MHNHTYIQQRVDNLAMFYMEKHYNISSMSVDEFIKTFNKIYEEMLNSLELYNNK